MSDTRIYHVIDHECCRLVRARNASQARNHVLRGRFLVRVASQNDLELLLGNGAKVEQATDEMTTAAEVRGILSGEKTDG